LEIKGSRPPDFRNQITPMTTPLTREEAAKVALLARLKLDDRELEGLTRQLGQILEYVGMLGEVDTEGVEPMAHAVQLANVFRPDEERPSLARDSALANAPKTDGRYFVVPGILETS
jgi:aspartyl-tRNA(Asn)/glutamyl-tRNA(Gln) amidotransferase subunit C